MKKCNTCQLDKSLDDFYKRSGGRYYMGTCKVCFASTRKKYRKKIKAPGYWRKNHIKWKYGITLEQLEDLLRNQDFKCKICNVDFDNSIKSTTMCIDHDHKTNKVRGLLCNSCNVGLGLFKDNIDALQNAILYLESGD